MRSEKLGGVNVPILKDLSGRLQTTTDLRGFKLSKRDPDFDMIGPLQQAAIQGTHILTFTFRNFEVNVSFPKHLNG